MTKEAETAAMWSQAKKCWQPPAATGGEEMDPRLEPLEGTELCQHADCSSVGGGQAFGFQGCVRGSFCCLRSPRFWWFLTAAIRN